MTVALDDALPDGPVAEPFEDLVEVDEETVRAEVGQLTITGSQKKLTPLQLRAFMAICNFDPRKEPQSWPYINVWLQVCFELRLSPWSKQIYLYKRGDGRWARYVIQTSIHGLTGLAKRTGRFIKWCGTYYTSDEDTPEWWREVTDPETGQVVRERVWVSSWIWKDKHPAVARTYMAYYDQRGEMQIMHADAHWHSYAPYRPKTVGEGEARRRVVDPETGEFVMELPAFWSRDGGALMLAKCCRAHALRLEFPDETGGIFLDEELHREDAENEARALADARAARAEAYAAAQVEQGDQAAGVHGVNAAVHTPPAPVNAPVNAPVTSGNTPARAARAPVNAPVRAREHGVNTHAGQARTPTREPVNEGVHEGVNAGGEHGVNACEDTPCEGVNASVTVTPEQRREWVLAEIAKVSEMLGKDVSVPIVKRLGRRPGVTLDDLDTEEILPLLGSFRPVVAERLRADGDHDSAAAYLSVPRHVAAPVHVLFGWDPPGDGTGVSEE